MWFMSRIKAVRLFALALAILLLMHSVVLASELPTPEPQDIIDLEQETPQQTTFETAQVERGTLTQTASTVATPYYRTYDIRFEQNGAKFVEYTVETRDTVKSGDILARFTLTASDAEITRLKLDLQRAEEQVAEGIRQREREIERKRAELNNASDTYEKEILALSLKKLETELKQYKHRQQYSIDQKRDAYDEENRRRKTDILVSPVDGVVKTLTYKRVDDPVSPYETLVTIASENSVMFMVPNTSGSLRYNMPVEVRLGNTTNSEWLSGRIVAADDVIPEVERPFDPDDRYALIQLDTYDEKLASLKSLNVTTTTAQMNNVLLIPHAAISREKETGTAYVTKLVNGTSQKSYIQTALNGNEGIWVLEGVEEGETLLLY